MPKLLTHSLALALLASMGFAAQAQQSPSPGASPGTPPSTTQRPAAADPTTPGQQAGRADIQSLAAVDAQIGAMHSIHEKLRQAKTPQERQAVRAEHWRIMQQARETMRRDEMGWGGSEGKMGPGKGMGPPTGMMGGPGSPSAAPSAPPMDPAQREAWNQRRLDMMHAMMEMMMEYLPATPPSASPASPTPSR